MEFNTNMLNMLKQLGPLLQSFGGFGNQQANYNMQQNYNNSARQGQVNEQISKVMASYPTETIDKPKASNQKANSINNLNNQNFNNPTANYQNQLNSNQASEQHNLQNSFGSNNQANFGQQNNGSSNNMLANLLKGFLSSQNGNAGGDMLSSFSSLMGNLGSNTNENGANLLSSIMQNNKTNLNEKTMGNQNASLIKRFSRVEDIEIEN